MTTSYPSGLDSLSNPSSGDPLSNPSHSAQHANANDAIEAIETAIGVKFGARCKVYLSAANQTIPDSASSDTTLAFDAEAFDTDGFQSGS